MFRSVFITGGTGFVGSELTNNLLNDGFVVYALVRDKEKMSLRHDKLHIVEGDVLKPNTYEDALKYVDCVVHLVGIIKENKEQGITFERLHFEATKIMIDAAGKNGIKRFVHMSANGANVDAETAYHITKYKAEKYVKNSNLTYTIFKPSVIYGPKDSFVNMLINSMKRMPVFFYFGDGNYKLQPVSVFEVSQIFSKSINNEKTFNKEFTVCGEEIFTYKKLLQKIRDIKGIIKPLFPLPSFITESFIDFFGEQSWFPITKNQYKMLIGENTCENTEIFDILNVEKMNFENTIKSYLK